MDPKGKLKAAAALFGAVLALALGAAPALADAGKVLVFTGTAGTANPASADIADAIKALGTANDFTVDVTGAASAINTANLADYRAVVFVHSAGDVLDEGQEAALQSYVNDGGGFVGLGETARLEQGGASFFNTLLGLSGARITGEGESKAADVEFLDRVHPASRQLPLVAKGQTETWYTWATNPTGTVHTVARVRGNELPDGTSVTNDAVQRFTGGTNTIQPQLNRPAAWCRDIQQGRSFYTELGSSSASVGDANIRKHLLGAVQWAAGMVRGNCKASINSNYSATKITPMNPPGQNSDYVGEMTKSALADDGRVFYGGRAICYAGQVPNGNWDVENTGLGCGTIHVWDPRVEGSNNSNPAKIAKVAELSVFGNKGNAHEFGPASTAETGLVGMVLDPDFTKGRPYMYVQYYPYWGGEQGKNTLPSLGKGFDRPSYFAEKRLSRFTYDEETKKFVPGSEKVIFTYMTSVFSCCHAGAGMAFDSQGNLYVTNGDNVGNSANANNGGYANPDPAFTVPCPGHAPTTRCGLVPEDQRPAGMGPLTSFGDARATSSNTNVYEGKIIRIKPVDNPPDTPGLGLTYTIPGADAPNGPNLFPPGSQPVLDGKAKPEIFAMGVRSDYTIHIDPKTDAITTAWIGPDQGIENGTWGPAKTENATMMNSAGNWGWPYCQAGNRWNYRAKLPNNGQNGGLAAPAGHPGTVGGGEDGQTGGYWDCSKELLNDSPYNTGLTTLPAPKPVNIWYGPQGGCYGYQRNANGVPLYSPQNTTPAPQTYRACPWIIGGSQAPIDGGIYRKPAGEKPEAWPEYWDGRWFLIDFANTNATRHAMLMDPETQFKGGQPVAVDSLYGIVTTSLIPGVRPVFMDFGADGALYVGVYSGSYYRFVSSNNTMAVFRFAYTGGPDTPGPDPKAVVPQYGSEVEFNVGKSGGVSYTWDFGDGSEPVTTTERSISHEYRTGGNKTAKLTVTYADGETASKTVAVENVTPLFTEVEEEVSADVPFVLALTLGGSPDFGAFTPSVTRDYTASTTATALATSGGAQLSVSDAAAGTTGQLVNGDYALPSKLKVRATSTVGTGGAFADVGSSASPTPLVTYARAANDPAIGLQFSQHVAASDPLRAGRYSKTLTFTLSTTNP